MSARDIYSLIYQPEGGSYVQDAFKKICNSGCVVEAEAPSHAPDGTSSESFMRNRADITPQEQNDGMTYLAKNYVTWNNTNLDLYKQAIVQGNGCVAVTWGNNACFATDKILMPDTASQMAWRHGVYFTGYDDTKKTFEFVNSWSNAWGTDGGFGHLPYDYVTKGYVSNPMTLVDVPNGTYVSLMSIIENLKSKILALLKLKK
jgi:C1A family cysteine protease